MKKKLTGQFIIKKYGSETIIAIISSIIGILISRTLPNLTDPEYC